MGTTGINTTLGSTFSSNIATVVGAVLAGLGIWMKPKRQTSGQTKLRGQVQDRIDTLPHANALTMTILPTAIEVPRPLQPLRVIRFIDADLPAANAGRMVISGRMSDVCAELDRLAA